LQVINHLIDGKPLYKASPNVGGALVNPTLLVMHFTASGVGARGDADFLSNPNAKASAHVVVGETGDYYQIVPFNKKAWHAGVSSWKGKNNCNDYSIGIEVDNWGIVTKKPDGTFQSWTKAPVDASRVVHLKNKRGVDAYWQTYTDIQLAKVGEITKAILAAYPSIKEIVGHEDVAPGRKTDPGPAFPLARFQSLLTH